MRLFPKLLLAFLTIALLSVLVVAGWANITTAREVQTFMAGAGMTTESALVEQLAAYYQGRGSWAGVATLLRPAEGHGMMMGQRLVLVDAANQVVVDTRDLLLPGEIYAPAQGWPIVVEGQTVGTLAALGNGMMMGSGATGTGQQMLLQRVNNGIWLAALTATALALGLGSLLAFGLVRPVQALTAATRAIAQGQLAQRVQVTSRDEVGELAQSFNQMAANLQQGEQLRRDMTADIAHELRNPLAVLQSNLEALVDGVLPPSPDNLQPLLEQTHLLTRLVDDLRTLALAEAGQLPLNRARTDPAELAQNVVARFAALAEAQQVSLQTEFAAHLPAIHVDAQRLAQVLGNLLSNALRHTPAGGTVVCAVTATVTEVRFSVRDTGAGIPAADLPHIFERFYRARRQTTETSTGLGLAIAKQLVEAHGGHITAQSVVGQGTEVIFRVPI